MPEEGLSGRDPDANQKIWPFALAPQRGCRASATGNFSLGSARVPVRQSPERPAGKPCSARRRTPTRGDAYAPRTLMLTTFSEASNENCFRSMICVG